MWPGCAYAVPLLLSCLITWWANSSLQPLLALLHHQKLLHRVMKRSKGPLRWLRCAGWLAVLLLMLGLALDCARLTVGSQGCAVTVITAASTLPGTWAKGFLLVLAGSWLHKLWSKHTLGYLFSALYVLGIGLTINHTAGFSASLLSGLPTLQLEHSTFQGSLKVPALLAEAVSGLHAKAWYQATSFAVNWGSRLLFVVSSFCFAIAIQGLGNADSTKKVGQKGPAAIPGAAVCAAQDLIAGCSSSPDEPLFAVVQVAAATTPKQKGWRMSEEVIHWREWQEEEQGKIYCYWQLPNPASNMGGQALGWLMWAILSVGCVYAVRSRGIELPPSRLPLSVKSIWFGMGLGNLLHNIKSKAIWLLNGIKSGKSGIMRCSHAGKSQLLEATSASLNARLGLAHATSEAHALASSSGGDQQPNTIWEVQLVKGDHVTSQQSQSYAGELSAVRFLDIERGTEDWDEVPDSARIQAEQAESALKQAQAQAEEEAGEQAWRSISLAAEAVREADLELQPAAQALKTAAAQEKEAKQMADGSGHDNALKAAHTRAEQAENALQEQQLKMAAREQDAEQSVAARPASIVLDRTAQAKAGGDRELVSKAHETERVTEAAVQRAEFAEGALRRLDALEHKIAKLLRVFKKWAVLQKKGKVEPKEVTIGSKAHREQ